MSITDDQFHAAIPRLQAARQISQQIKAVLEPYGASSGDMPSMLRRSLRERYTGLLAELKASLAKPTQASTVTELTKADVTVAITRLEEAEVLMGHLDYVLGKARTMQMADPITGVTFTTTPEQWATIEAKVTNLVTQLKSKFAEMP